MILPGWSRDALIQSIDPIYEVVSKEQKENALGIMTFFSLMGETAEGRFTNPPVVKHKTSKQEILQREKALLGFFLTGHPMDEYKRILERLSCVPLRRLEGMDHDTVFRSAFIVESAQIRISAKSQRKFAILVISDGIERQELPIWSDLYEEKSHLLKENQLLYAVLQVDKKEEEMRLLCRWLDDLTQADEAMIEACDRAYDKAKYQIGKYSSNKNNPKFAREKSKNMNTTIKKTSMTNQLLIKLDADQARLSHILQLKRVFSQYPGEVPVQIHFHAGGRSLATLHIDSKWGIAWDEQIKQKIKEISSVLSVEA